jgi:hypothetical protein
MPQFGGIGVIELVVFETFEKWSRSSMPGGES